MVTGKKDLYANFGNKVRGVLCGLTLYFFVNIRQFTEPNYFFGRSSFLQKRARKAFKQDKESIMEIASTFSGQMRDKHLLQQKSVNPQGETSVNFETYVRDKDHIWRFG